MKITVKYLSVLLENINSQTGHKYKVNQRNGYTAIDEESRNGYINIIAGLTTKETYYFILGMQQTIFNK